VARRAVARGQRPPSPKWASARQPSLASRAKAGGPGRTRTCNQTVMSGGITMGFVDVAVFLSQSDRVRCPSVGSFLVRNRCGHACSCRRVGIDMYRSLSPFRMIMERIDLALSRLKQGFDSPRERHSRKFALKSLANLRLLSHSGFWWDSQCSTSGPTLRRYWNAGSPYSLSVASFGASEIVAAATRRDGSLWAPTIAST
jgi:hypothetical protein